jgi:multidrug efflux pump subunit AcrB
MMSPNVSEDRLHSYQLSSENIGNQLQSGNSMMSPNVSEDRLHRYQLSSENIENQLLSGNSMITFGDIILFPLGS